jgi:hypothetical protein
VVQRQRVLAVWLLSLLLLPSEAELLCFVAVIPRVLLRVVLVVHQGRVVVQVGVVLVAAVPRRVE